jgi:hypothetical protein
MYTMHWPTSGIIKLIYCLLVFHRYRKSQWKGIFLGKFTAIPYYSSEITLSKYYGNRI